MKIVDLDTFLKLPEGTIFCKGDKYMNWESLCVKKGTLHRDFYYINLCDCDFSSSERRAKMIDDPFNQFVSINQSPERDGCFDEEALFLIYEYYDLKILFFFTQQAISNIES